MSRPKKYKIEPTDEEVKELKKNKEQKIIENDDKQMSNIA